MFYLSVYTPIVVDTVISKVSQKLKIIIKLQNKVDASSFSFSFSEPNKTRI